MQHQEMHIFKHVNFQSLVFATLLPVVLSQKERCFEQSLKNYTLSWQAQGVTFFDDWDYGEQDFTGGAVRYLPRDEAMAEKLTVPEENYAILRPGAVENTTRVQRKSIRLSSAKNWTYYLTAMRYNHVPYGCGVWPAFWSNGASGNWPRDGELDILEHWNGAKSEVSFHTIADKADGCKLDPKQLNKEGCPHFADINNVYLPWLRYDCQTNYSEMPPHLGCAPQSDKHPRKTGQEYADNPGVMAAEWTKDFIKVFYIPETEIPSDLAHGVSPRPDTWDRWILSYYPFAASDKAIPGSCPLTSRSLASAQSFVLNIELCGDRASHEFPWECGGEKYPLNCKRQKYATYGDCCYDYMTNAEKSDSALEATAFFNISWIKVWQQE